jgi:type I restriction enzyme S subunit
MIQKQEFIETEIGRIPEDWDTKKICEIDSSKEAVQTGPFGSLLHAHDYAEEGVPLLLVKNIAEGRVTDENIPKVNFKKAQELKKFWLKKEDIVFTRVGAVGRTLYVSKDYEGWMFSGQTLRLRIKSDKMNNQFIEYFFRSPKFQNTSEATALGTTRPSINTSILANTYIPIPPIIEQDKIVGILSSLDDKIAINRSMNTTIEAIGQALFRRWFVDFEFPNEEGKPYRSSGGEMVETELGKVPREWGVGTLGELCDIIMGQSPPGTTYNEICDGLPFYQGITDFGFRFPIRRVYCTAPTRFANEGDVLLSVRAPVGSLNVADERCAIGRGLAALRLKGKHHGYLYYLLCATQSGWNKFEAEGTVFGSVNKADVHDFRVISPPETLQTKFGSLMEPLDKHILNNEKQSLNLAAIRDALLPKLMSGEIRVKVEQDDKPFINEIKITQ